MIQSNAIQEMQALGNQSKAKKRNAQHCTARSKIENETGNDPKRVEKG